MSEIKFVTTTGRYGYNPHGPNTPNDPEFPSDVEGWHVQMVGSAAADGILFWFWQCELPDPPPVEIVHSAVFRLGLHLSRCNAGTPDMWPKGERWSDDKAKVTCPKCLEAIEADAPKGP